MIRESLIFYYVDESLKVPVKEASLALFCAKKSSYHQYTSSLCSYHIWTSKENLFKMAAGATPQPIHKRLELYVTPGHFLDFEISDQCEFQQDYFKSYIKQGDSILMINCKYI